MKPVLFALLLAAVTPGTAAQDDSRGGMQRGPHGNHEERLERMRSHLGLSDEQVAQMRSIRESDASRQEKREQMRAVLTEEQQDMMRQHRQQHGGNRHSQPDKKGEQEN